MTTKPRIRIDLIDQVQQVLDALPKHQPDEVTKSQAIERLLPQIRESQSKGYSLVAIGKVLTERGIPVTPGALRAHLSGATARSGGGKKQRRPKRTSERAPRAQSADPKADAASASTTGPKVVDPRRKATAGSGADLDWDAGGQSEKVARGPNDRALPPRPDADLRDI